MNDSARPGRGAATAAQTALHMLVKGVSSPVIIAVAAPIIGLLALLSRRVCFRSPSVSRRIG